MRAARDECPKIPADTTLWHYFEKAAVKLPEISEKTFDNIGGVDVCGKLALMCARFQQYLTHEWHAQSLKRLQTVYRFGNLQQPDLCSVLQEIVTVSAVTVTLFVLMRFDSEFKVCDCVRPSLGPNVFSFFFEICTHF
jgi:hypothetical protein